MKQFLLILTVFLFLFQSVFSQLKRSPKPWRAFISIGYGSTTSDNLSEYYNILVDNYRISGVPIRTQEEFGPTLLANGGIILNILENIGAGISFEYLYSPAFSHYKDFAGTVKINGSIKCYNILLKVNYIPWKIGNLALVLSPQIGACHSSVIMTQEVRFNEFPESNYDWKMSKSGWGPCVQGTIGALINLEEFFVSLEGGFRYGRIQVAKQKEESTSETIEVIQVMDIALDGFITHLSFGIRF